MLPRKTCIQEDDFYDYFHKEEVVFEYDENEEEEVNFVYPHQHQEMEQPTMFSQMTSPTKIHCSDAAATSYMKNSIEKMSKFKSHVKKSLWVTVKKFIPMT